MQQDLSCDHCGRVGKLESGKVGSGKVEKLKGGRARGKETIVCMYIVSFVATCLFPVRAHMARKERIADCSTCPRCLRFEWSMIRHSSQSTEHISIRIARQCKNPVRAWRRREEGNGLQRTNRILLNS